MLVAFAFSGGYLTAFLWGRQYAFSTGEYHLRNNDRLPATGRKVQRPALDLSRLLPSFINALTAVERLMELEELPSKQVEPHTVPQTPTYN